MDALIRKLYTSDLFEVTDFACRCAECGYSGVEFQNKFSICYIRRGSFLFKVFSDELECYNSRFLINRPGFTHRVKHYHTQPDQCMIIGFSTEFYEKNKDIFYKAFSGFLTDENIHSMVLQSSSETEYLMYRLKYALAASETDSLLIDGIVLDLTDKIFRMQGTEQKKTISEKQKHAFLPAIEKSREWVHENFAETITMEDLARLSYMSVFHFNRAFKEIVRMSPYQYLLNFRIQHAAHLLVSTDEAISGVGWSAGFNSPDHFSYAFKGVTGLSPLQYRNRKTQEF